MFLLDQPNQNLPLPFQVLERLLTEAMSVEIHPIHLLGAIIVSFDNNFFLFKGLGKLPRPLCYSSISSTEFTISFIVGNGITSRIEDESVRIIMIRSIPIPKPPVGGRPTSMAFKKSSSIS